jgi:Rad3-related DNA helicase
MKKSVNSRLQFDSDGSLVSVDRIGVSGEVLRKPREVVVKREFADIYDEDYWSLCEGEQKLKPLKFSNGKTQADIVKEVCDLIKAGEKIVFIHGTCGTGKSAIALNIARELGRASIVVPVKGLQRQYEEDYRDKKHVLKKNGERMRIAMITGRDNHDSLIEPGKTCADPFLPDNIQITKNNSELLKKYYKENPFIGGKDVENVLKLRRISVAPSNPYWSPIISASYELKQLSDASMKKYRGLNNRDFIFYHRKRGCTYYDQYQSYIDGDVIIFNSAKYKIETALDRKPATDVEIIDEGDEFLDNFANQEEINLTRLARSLNQVIPDDVEIKGKVEGLIDLIKLEEKNKKALGIDEGEIFEVDDTKIGRILRKVLEPGVESEIQVDEGSYANRAVEIARDFVEFLDDSYVSFREHEDNLFVNIVTTNVSRKLKEMVDKNRAFVFMSGTLHSKEVLKNIFGLDSFRVVEAESVQQGTIEIQMSGKEFDCKYSNLNGRRKDYLTSLNACLSAVVNPVLVHVNAYSDLPTSHEVGMYGVHRIMSREKLLGLQGDDRTGRMISMFKQGMSDSLFSTKCNRGVDFPGETCRSIVFTKYPNPNVKNIFWKVLEKTHKDWYWEFYRDKARREFLQRIYRAVRSRDDHVFVLSPDLRVINAVRDLQRDQ